MTTAQKTAEGIGQGRTHDAAIERSNDANIEFRDILNWIERRCNVGVVNGEMWFVVVGDIIPMVSVTAEFSGGEVKLFAEAGPGQNLSQTTLEAFQEAALRRVKRNRAERLEAERMERESEQWQQ